MMRRWNMILLAALLLAGVLIGQTFVKGAAGGHPAGRNRLGVLWTSGDPDVAHKVCFMYTHAAKSQKWFDEVVLIVWGPSSRLLAGDRELAAKVKAMMADGVVVQACKACADLYGVSDDLRALDIEVKYMGQPLSDMLKSDWKVLTF